MKNTTDDQRGESFAASDGSASTPRTDLEWNTYEPQCADPSQLAELMYQWACKLEIESGRRHKDIFRMVGHLAAALKEEAHQMHNPPLHEVNWDRQETAAAVLDGISRALEKMSNDQAHPTAADSDRGRH